MQILRKRIEVKVDNVVDLNFLFTLKMVSSDGGQDQDFPYSHDARTEAATIATSREGELCRKEGLEQTSRSPPWLFSSIRVISS